MKTKKKNWYDYLWLATIAYFVLGTVQCGFCLVGNVMHGNTFVFRNQRRQKNLLQQILWPKPAYGSLGNTFQVVQT